MAIVPVTGQNISAGFGISGTGGGTLTLTNDPTPGNFVVVGISIGVTSSSSVAGCTVTDSNSNSYTQALISPAQNGTSAETVLLFYLANAPANAKRSILIAGLPVADLNGWAIEFSGVLASSPYDSAQKHTTTTSSTNINDPAMTPSVNGSLMIAVAMAGQTIASATSPWTMIGTVQNGNAAAYYVQPTVFSQAIGFTQAPTGDWTSIVAAFKPAVAGTGPAVIDASSPARVNVNSNGIANDVITASFVAPAGSLLVAVCAADFSGDLNITVADSLGLTWTQQKKTDLDTPTTAGNGGATAIWTATTVSAVARTVLMHHNSGSTIHCSMKVYAVVYQNASPIGASGNNNTTTTNAPTLAMFTSTAANSLAIFGACDWAANGDPTSSDSTVDNHTDVASITATSGYKALGGIGAQTVALDYPGTAATQLSWSALEIKSLVAGSTNTLTASNLTVGSPVLPTPTFIFGLQLGDYVLDNGLSGLDTVCDKIYICTQQPTTFTEAVTTFAIGNKNWGAGNAFGAPAAGTGGRQITSVAITNGSVTANGTPAAWAAVDSANSRLLASGNMTGAIAVTNGQVFTLSALTFLIPNT